MPKCGMALHVKAVENSEGVSFCDCRQLHFEEGLRSWGFKPY
jgi:hypothetical protein